MSCKCHESWAGLFCQAPCPSDCVPSGQCVTSTNNQAICLCNQTSRYKPGQGCVFTPPELLTTSTEPPATTPQGLRPLLDRECLGVFTCLWGFCQVSSLQCLCDPGWKGQLCDQPCELNCSGHGRCRENEQFIPACQCDPSYSGEFCEILLERQPISPPQNGSEVKKAEVDTSAWSDHSPSPPPSVSGPAPPLSPTSYRLAKGDEGNQTRTAATLRPLTERECPDELVCQHGHCNRSQRWCHCDPGWGGQLCDQSCDLACLNQATCLVSHQGTPHCACATGYMGDNCQINQKDDRWKDLGVQNGLELPPLTQRFCEAGWVCAYGVCPEEPSDREDCICDHSFSGKYCETPCPAPCLVHQHCQLNPADNMALCVCEPGFYGPNCTELAADSLTGRLGPTDALTLSLVLLLVLPLLALLALVVSRRNSPWVMRLIYWLRPYEDDDRDLDALIVYGPADTDRQFVIQTLVPKLEGRMCLTLNILQLNQPFQMSIKNLADLVDRSRRLILVVSSPFLTPDWQHDRRQLVIQELLMAKHRTVLILLGDVKATNKDVFAPLKPIFKSARQLKYPAPDSIQQENVTFWKRLQLLMPKTRGSYLEAGKGHSCLIPSEFSPLENSSEIPPATKLRMFFCSNGQSRPFLPIVRVPAVSLDSTVNSSTVGCLTRDKIYGGKPENDSDFQNRGCAQRSPEGHARLKQTHALDNNGAGGRLPYSQEPGVPGHNADYYVNDGHFSSGPNHPMLPENSYWNKKETSMNGLDNRGFDYPDTKEYVHVDPDYPTTKRYIDETPMNPTTNGYVHLAPDYPSTTESFNVSQNPGIVDGFQGVPGSAKESQRYRQLTAEDVGSDGSWATSLDPGDIPVSSPASPALA